jgi:hypothetical protein
MESIERKFYDALSCDPEYKAFKVTDDLTIFVLHNSELLGIPYLSVYDKKKEIHEDLGEDDLKCVLNPNDIVKLTYNAKKDEYVVKLSDSGLASLIKNDIEPDIKYIYGDMEVEYKVKRVGVYLNHEGVIFINGESNDVFGCDDMFIKSYLVKRTLQEIMKE